MSIRSSWQSIEGNNRSRFIRNYTKTCRRAQTWPSYHCWPSEADCKGKKLDKWIVHGFCEVQKNHRYEVYSKLFLRNKLSISRSNYELQEKKWVLHSNQQNSAQWLRQDEISRHFSNPKLHRTKIRVTVWWSAIGTIHCIFLDFSKTIVIKKYCQKIDVIFQKVAAEHPAVANRKRPIVLYENAWPHVSMISQQKSNAAGLKKLLIIYHTRLSFR